MDAVADRCRPDGQGQGQLEPALRVPGPGCPRDPRLTITGADWQVTAKGYGLVFHDTGLVRFVPGGDDVIDITHGPTDSDHGNLDLVMPAVCAILAG